MIHKRKRVLYSLMPIMLCVLCLTGCQKEDEPWQPGMPLEKEKIKIGVIHLSDAAEGYSYAHDIGVRQMQSELGLDDSQIIRKLNVDDADNVMSEHIMRECIAEGVNVILATSWGYMEACEKLAAEYPGVVFAHASGYKYNKTNFTNYFGRVYQARYLSGVIAGLVTKSDKLGFVAAMDKTNSEVTGSIDAFAMGVESVNPTATIYVRVTNSWYDPAGERMAAIKLIDEGCDVITQHCDTSAPQTEAEKSGIFSIGYSSDPISEAPNSTITSVVWNWGVYYTYLVGSVIDGSFTTTPYYGGLAEGIVDMTPINEKISTPEIEKTVAEVRKRILSGELNIFDGVLETNDGQKIGSPNTTLSDDEITCGINWYYRNVVEEKF